MRQRAATALALALAVSACVPSAPDREPSRLYDGNPDGSVVQNPDASSVADAQVHPDADAPPTDAGFQEGPDGSIPVDVGFYDAGFVDAGFYDSGFRDAGFPDSGAPAPDASQPPPDAGPPAPDASQPPPDAGTPTPDAGTPPAPTGYVLIPAGSFTMGTNNGQGDEGPPHSVTLTRAFWMKATETTQSEYQSRTGGNPSNRFQCGGNCPVEQLNTWSTFAYLNALSQSQGLAPCYALPSNCSGSAASGNLSCAGSVGINAPGGNPYLCAGYRLPTEAEWEYAYRAGSTSQFYSGGMTYSGCSPRDPTLDAIGWYCGNSANTSHPVGQKAPNAFGLYDMAGNVWELVGDGYSNYGAQAVTDPRGNTSSAIRLVRGGGWSYDAERCRATTRVQWDAQANSWAVGFRPVRTAL